MPACSAQAPASSTWSPMRTPTRGAGRSVGREDAVGQGVEAERVVAAGPASWSWFARISLHQCPIIERSGHEREQRWRTTSGWAASHPSGTPSTGGRRRGEAGRALLRGADGGGGLLVRLVAALPPRHPVGDRRLPRVAIGDLSTTPNHPLLPRHLRLHDLFDAAAVRRSRRGHRPPAGAGQRRRADLVCGVGRCAEPVVPQRDRRRVRVRRARVGPGSRRCSARSRSAPGDYVVIPRATTHRWVPDGRRGIRLRAYASRPTATSPRRSGTCRSTASCSSTRPTASATCRRRRAAAGRGRRRTRRRRDRGVHQAPRRRARAASSARSYAARSTRSTSSAGTAASTRTSSTSRDFEPITGRVHQPPPVHQVFEGWNFVICNFVPRKVDYHPLSIPVPYYHSNVDSDEIMFYVDGDYEARKGSGIGKGSISRAPRRARARSAAGRDEGSIGVELLRRARGHGRHVPAAGARRGRPRGRRRQVRPQLAPRRRHPAPAAPAEPLAHGSTSRLTSRTCLVVAVRPKSRRQVGHV